MIVVDASVLVDALTSDDAPGRAARAELARDRGWAAPEHLRIEVFSAIRGRVLGGKVTVRRGAEAVASLAALHVETVSFAVLNERMWALRDNVSGYDAAYVAAAEHLGCPLVTGDAPLARATGPRCEIRLAFPRP